MDTLINDYIKGLAEGAVSLEHSRIEEDYSELTIASNPSNKQKGYAFLCFLLAFAIIYRLIADFDLDYFVLNVIYLTPLLFFGTMLAFSHPSKTIRKGKVISKYNLLFKTWEYKIKLPEEGVILVYVHKDIKNNNEIRHSIGINDIPTIQLYSDSRENIVQLAEKIADKLKYKIIYDEEERYE